MSGEAYYFDETDKQVEPGAPRHTERGEIIKWSESLTPEVRERYAKQRAKIDRARREARREGYDAAITEYLPRIAEIQGALLGMIEKARDPATGEIDPVLLDTKTAKVLLDATDKILDRVMGKATTKIDARVQHSVVDELARLAEEA